MKIAAICAWPKFNRGMLSVDAAIFDVLQRNCITADVELFSLQEGTIAGAQSRWKDLTYTKLTKNRQLDGFDAVLIWGDFLGARPFLLGNDAQQQMKRGQPLASADDASEQIYRLLLLEGASEDILNKTICFGGTVYVNGPQDDWDLRYRAAISRLFKTAKLVLTRDPLSAAFAQQFGAAGSALGVDAAFLLSSDAPLIKPTKTLSYSFGRGIADDRSALRASMRFVRNMASRTGMSPPVELKWLARDKKQPMQQLQEKIDQIRNSALVITDTYHCAVTAMREGVPVICIGFGAQHPSTAVSEKKKELMYSMFNARDLYVFIENLGLLSTRREVERVAAAIPNKAIHAGIQMNVKLATRRAEVTLIEALVALGANTP